MVKPRFLAVSQQGWLNVVGENKIFAHHIETGKTLLTAILADATNLGLARMAEACNIATRR